MAAMEQPPLARVIAALPPNVPFVGPETLERRTGVPFVARLGANESAFGPSPLAVAAIAAAAADGWMYGDPEAFALRTALAAHHEPALEQRGEHRDARGLLHDALRDGLVAGRHDFLEHQHRIVDAPGFVRGLCRKGGNREGNNDQGVSHIRFRLRSAGSSSLYAKRNPISSAATGITR